MGKSLSNLWAAIPISNLSLVLMILTNLKKLLELILFKMGLVKNESGQCALATLKISIKIGVQ